MSSQDEREFPSMHGIITRVEMPSATNGNVHRVIMDFNDHHYMYESRTESMPLSGVIIAKIKKRADMWPKLRSEKGAQLVLTRDDTRSVVDLQLLGTDLERQQIEIDLAQYPGLPLTLRVYRESPTDEVKVGTRFVTMLIPAEFNALNKRYVPVSVVPKPAEKKQKKPPAVSVSAPAFAPVATTTTTTAPVPMEVDSFPPAFPDLLASAAPPIPTLESIRTEVAHTNKPVAVSTATAAAQVSPVKIPAELVAFDRRVGGLKVISMNTRKNTSEAQRQRYFALKIGRVIPLGRPPSEAEWEQGSALPGADAEHPVSSVPVPLVYSTAHSVAIPVPDDQGLVDGKPFTEIPPTVYYAVERWDATGKILQVENYPFPVRATNKALSNINNSFNRSHVLARRNRTKEFDDMPLPGALYVPMIPPSVYNQIDKEEKAVKKTATTAAAENDDGSGVGGGDHRAPATAAAIRRVMPVPEEEHQRNVTPPSKKLILASKDRTNQAVSSAVAMDVDTHGSGGSGGGSGIEEGISGVERVAVPALSAVAVKPTSASKKASAASAAAAATASDPSAGTVLGKRKDRSTTSSNAAAAAAAAAATTSANEPPIAVSEVAFQNFMKRMSGIFRLVFGISCNQVFKDINAKNIEAAGDSTSSTPGIRFISSKEIVKRLTDVLSPDSKDAVLERLVSERRIGPSVMSLFQLSHAVMDEVMETSGGSVHKK